MLQIIFPFDMQVLSLAVMTSYLQSPIGLLELKANDKALLEINFLDSDIALKSESGNEITASAKQQLQDYFEGKRTEFSVPIEPNGSQFEQSVWEHLQQIPYGQTVTYGELAKQLGDINKVRAVGKANGQNPVPIIIPCHRVIGSNNNLVGYSGGIERKKFLLKHEGALLL